MPVPDFVVVGHVTHDIVPGGWRPGGTPTFAAVQAHRLGLSVGVVTRTAGDVDLQSLLPFAQIVDAGSRATTTFENTYAGGERTQHIRAVGDPIELADLPGDWRSAPVILLGPVWHEVATSMAASFDERSLVGVSAQGWLRSADAHGGVQHTSWTGDPYWRGARVLFVSDEDLSGGGDELERWIADVPIVAMTESWRGARVYADGHGRRMDSFPEAEVDPTGAGDTFATGFLIRLHEVGDVGEAARFGAAAASLSVGGIVAEAIPTRAEVEARMRQYPDVALR